MKTTFDRYFSVHAKLKEHEDSITACQISYSQAIADASATIAEKEQQYKARLKELVAVETLLYRYMDLASKDASANGRICIPKQPDMDILKRRYTTLSTGKLLASKRKDIAQDLLYDSQCAQMYIAQKKQEEEESFQREQNAIHSADHITEIKAKIDNLEQKIAQDIYLQMQALLGEAALFEKDFRVDEQKIYAPAIPENVPQEMCLGYVTIPYTEREKTESHADSSSPFHTSQGTVIPFSVPGDGQADGMYAVKTLHVRYNDQTGNRVYRIIQSIVFNILRNYPPLCSRITYIDYSTFNDEFLQSLRCFTKENSLIQFPHHANQVNTCLSVLSATVSSEPEHERQRRFLIIKDSGNHNQDLLSHIANNASRNNITIIYITNSSGVTHFDQRTGHINIFSKQDQFYLAMPDADYAFQWFQAPAGLEEKAIQAFQDKLIPKKLGNEYENFFPLHARNGYVRDRRPLKLPYGMDSQGDIKYLKLEGMEFASFVMGASGSGKSTLLHALIAGVIRDYHPDEVELWLADLKLMEFSNYTHHRPPHVKYILMDSSREMVHDFIDLLHGEMERRQALLSAYGTNDCKNLPRNKYLPLLLVIIDEFSTLSDVIRDDDTYKRKLEQILVRGRGPGLRLIFSSQSYTDGAPALTKLARKQIQTRIAMKNTPEEIKMTLEVPSGELTEAYIHAINTLQEHYALHCAQKQDGLHQLDKVHGLYFNGRDEEGWKSRFALIDKLNQTMKPVPLSEFDPNKIDQYVEKKPIVVSSKSLQAFNGTLFGKEVSVYRQEPDNIVFDEDILVRFGQPRKLKENLFTVMTEENYENIFLLAGNQELTCGMSVIMSAIQSFRHHGGNVQFWAHARNRTYHFYKDSHISNFSTHVGAESIRYAIDDIRTKIQTHQKGNDLIVLLGMDSICADLNDSTDDGFSVSVGPEKSPEEILLGKKSDTPKALNTQNQILVTSVSSAVPRFNATQIEPLPRTEADTSALKSRIEDELEEMDKLYDQFYDEQSALGKSDEEIDEAFEEFYADYRRKKYGYAIPDSPKVSATTIQMDTILTAPVTETFPVVIDSVPDTESDHSSLKGRIEENLAEMDELYDQFFDEQSALGKTDEEIDEAFDIFYAEYCQKKYGIASQRTPGQKEKPQEIPNVIQHKTSKNYLKDFQQLIRVGSRYGYHFLVCVSNMQSLKTMGLGISMFNHRLSFKTDSTDTSGAIFNNNTSAYRLPEHTCYYSAYGTNSDSYAITPYLHPGITWGNWSVDENGIARDESRL